MSQQFWFTKEEIKKRLESGRGTGRKQSYKPWIYIQEISSKGTSYRVLSHRTGRVVHFLSKLEFLTFSLFDWDESICDIREQYPMDIETTLEVAEKAGIKHPKKGNKYHVFTTDILLDYDNIQSKQKAIQVKYIEDLMDKNTIQKLEIERRSFLAKGIEWQLMTELDIPYTQQVNIDWILGGKDLEISDEIHERVFDLWDEIEHLPNIKLTKACSDFDKRHGLMPGESLKVARNSFSYRILAFDIKKPYTTLQCKDIQCISRQIITGGLYAVG